MGRQRYEHMVTDMISEGMWRNVGETELDRHPDRDVSITDVNCTVVDGNFPWNLVTVHTNSGVTGVGEAFPGPASESVEFLAPELIGQNPFDVDRLVEHMNQVVSGLGGATGYSQAAVSGVELALWDLVGKLTGLPVYQLLGGKYRDAVEIYVDCHAGDNLAAAAEADPQEVYDPISYADVARDVVDEGFSALKFDLDVKSEDTDTGPRRLSNEAIDHKVDIVDAIRGEVGDSPTLAFDLHWNFSVETALRLATRLEEYRLAWLEDPVPPERPESHRRVTEGTSTPVLTGENVTRLDGFLPYLTEGAVDLVAPDIQKAGGLVEFRRIAALADAFDIPMAPHNISSPVGTIGSVHVCATVQNVIALEWHAREVPWWDDLYQGAPLIDDGEIRVPEEPGLGLELDVDTINEHRVPGEDPLDLE